MPDGLRTNATDYESDFFLWTQEQGLRLRALARTEDASVDWENIAEEIESLGRRERIEIESRLETLLEQLLRRRFSTATDPRYGGEYGPADAAGTGPTSKWKCHAAGNASDACSGGDGGGSRRGGACADRAWRERGGGAGGAWYD